MDQQELKTRVKQVIARVLKAEPDTIADDANFVFDLGADSVQSVQLVAAFEEEFGVDLEEEKALTVQTVDGAVDFIAQHLPQ